MSADRLLAVVGELATLPMKPMIDRPGILRHLAGRLNRMADEAQREHEFARENDLFGA